MKAQLTRNNNENKDKTFSQDTPDFEDILPFEHQYTTRNHEHITFNPDEGREFNEVGRNIVQRKANTYQSSPTAEYNSNQVKPKRLRFEFDQIVIIILLNNFRIHMMGLNSEKRL